MLRVLWSTETTNPNSNKWHFSESSGSFLKMRRTLFTVALFLSFIYFVHPNQQDRVPLKSHADSTNPPTRIAIIERASRAH